VFLQLWWSVLSYRLHFPLYSTIYNIQFLLSIFFVSEYFTNKRHAALTYLSPEHPLLFHRNFQIAGFTHAVPLVYYSAQQSQPLDYALNHINSVHSLCYWVFRCPLKYDLHCDESIVFLNTRQKSPKLSSVTLPLLRF